MSDKPAANTEAYRKWYASNKEQFNAKRRARYAANAQYRKKAINNSRQGRERTRPTGDEGALIRMVGVNEVKVYRISSVSLQIGVPVPVIRAWERKGIIPNPSFGRGHRVYTKNQVKLMKKIAACVVKFKADKKELKEKLINLKPFIYEQWEINL